MRTPKIEVNRERVRRMTPDDPSGKLYSVHDGYRWRLRAANGRIIAQSSEGYRRIRDLTRSMEITWPGSSIMCSGAGWDGRAWVEAGSHWWLETSEADIPIIVPEGVSLHSRRRP